jgi:hypothetical protein
LPLFPIIKRGTKNDLCREFGVRALLGYPSEEPAEALEEVR